jgi:negative regulator of flagellin synthesis FlgM
VPNKISSYNGAELPASIPGSTGNSALADKTQASATATTAAATSTADQVTLTGSARTLQKLNSVLASTPVVNAAKVATIKQAVQNGTYSVDPAKVADKLLKIDGELQ